MWEKEKMLMISIFSFYYSVFNPIKDKIIILANFILSSGNAFNLNQSENMWFGKEFSVWCVTIVVI